MFDGVKRVLNLLLGNLPATYTNFYLPWQNSQLLASWSIEIPRRAYVDRPERGTSGHSLQLVVRRQDNHCWHIRIVVEHGLVHASKPMERKAAIIQLCKAIDFGLLRLFDDTVTEVYIHTTKDTVTTVMAKELPVTLTYTPLPEGHPFHPDGKVVYVETREDPLRLRYPVYDGMTTTTRLVEWSDVCVMEELAVAVSTAHVASNTTTAEAQTYILKTIERVLYMPQDSEALQRELEVLQRVNGQGNVVRLVAAVVSDNPYNTNPMKASSRVLRGVLLEYHRNGTVFTALQTKKWGSDDCSEAVTAPLWRLWGAQLCTAVATLHEQDFTHMDIKPSNMVLDKDGNLVLIDVGGAGGVTREWLSPAMQHVLDPLATPLQDRKQNDIWAVGKVLSKFANASSPSDDSDQIRLAADQAMNSPVLTSLRQLGDSLTK